MTPISYGVMGPKCFHFIVTNENTTRRYLTKLCWKTTVVSAVSVTAQTLLDLTIKTVRRGSIVYTDKVKAMTLLCFVGTGISKLTISNTKLQAKFISMLLKDSGVSLGNNLLSSMEFQEKYSLCI